MKETYTTTATIIFNDDGIIRIVVKEGANIQLPDIENHFRVISRLTENKKAYVLIDARVDYSMSAEAREFSAEHSPASRIATAFITKSAAGKKIANLYLSINRPSVPTKMFSNEEDAVKWLLSYK